MQLALGIVCIFLGIFGWLGQFVSAVNFRLAQKLGLQEAGEHTDILYQRLERNTASWDSVSLWTLPVTGILMLLNHALWPILALVAGGIHIDTVGRESAKLLGLNAEGVRIGTVTNKKIAGTLFTLLFGVSVWLVVFAFHSLT